MFLKSGKVRLHSIYIVCLVSLRLILFFVIFRENKGSYCGCLSWNTSWTQACVLAGSSPQSMFAHPHHSVLSE